MSPSIVQNGGNNVSSADDIFEDDLNLSIVGIGVQYPPYHNGPEAVEILAKRFYPESNAMTKTLSINRFTGISARAAIGTPDHPIANQPSPPTISELNTLFMDWGVRLSVSACTQALTDARLSAADITHMVSTTCTNSANPGYDHFVAKELGLGPSTEKVLLHGIGCSGGLAAVRTACGLALGARARGRKARVLVCACEISSVLVRSELESIDQNREVRIGVCLFSDCASACVISNGIGEEDEDEDAEGSGSERVEEKKGRKNSVYDILGWKHELIDGTAEDLGFDVHPLGWKVILTPRVPSLTSAALPSAFTSLTASIPALSSSSPTTTNGPTPTTTTAAAAIDMDWALHPGGATILTGAQAAMGIDEEHLRCSYETYVEHGNSSSATILSVLKRERAREVQRSLVLGAAFGPGVTLEMMVLKRGGRCRVSSEGGEGDAVEAVNGHGNGEVNGVGHANGTERATTNGTGDGLEAVRMGDLSLQPEQLD